MTTTADAPRATEASAPVLDVRDLRLWYAGGAGPIKAVDGVSFTLRRGEVMGLVGESGCGKSTLGRALLGLRPESSGLDGEINFGGRNLAPLAPKQWPSLRGAGLGMIFQEPMTRLDPLMKVRDHFRRAIRAHEKVSVAEADARALEALRAMGIPPSRYANYPHEFSGGMRQRIMIALALSLRPQFVVADEPTTALDVLVEAQIVRILADIKQTFAPAMILVTHNLGIVGQACDKVAVMYAGRIVEQGTVQEVFTNPQHPYTQKLLGATISLSTTELVSIPGAPPDLVHPPSGCRFRPRCDQAMSVCAERQPVPVTLASGVSAECHLTQRDHLSAAERAPLVQEVSDVDEA
ncbi:ABC transporter ATP-binding protein [Micrococcales bacterium 31B]|nr:ABC transporter ATP-binding protein [Micrococcales bacterium 31B]